MPLLEVGIFRPTTKEVSKSLLQVSQSLLQRYTANFVQELQVFLLFPSRKHRGSFSIVNSLLLLIPGFRPRKERSVVHQPRTPHRPPQEIVLLGRWVKAISESLLHIPRANFLHFSTFLVRVQPVNIKPYLSTGSPPTFSDELANRPGIAFINATDSKETTLEKARGVIQRVEEANV